MKPRLPSIGWLIAFVGCLFLAGCGFLKPSGVEPRSFILTPLTGPAPPAGQSTLSVGVGPVDMPGYLSKTAFAVLHGTNEVDYLDMAVWAERLNIGLRRVVAADLAVLLSTDRVHISTWRTTDVNVEVLITVDQFDVDKEGLGVLSAW